MKINLSVSEKGTQRNWPRAARHVLACGLLAFGLGSASAQVAISTLAGTNASITPGSTDGTGVAARFNTPLSVVQDGAGNLYVADSQNHTIRKIVISTGAVTTFAGAAGVSGTTDVPNTPTNARFNTPSGIAIDGNGNLYVADTLNHAIRKIVISTGAVTTVAGSPGVIGSANGTGTVARFFNPIGIAADRAGGSSAAAALYVADAGNHLIRLVTGTGTNLGVVTTLAGNANVAGSTNGTGTGAFFNSPKGVAVDNAGTTVYVADTSNNLIRKIVVAGGGVTTTFAGAGQGSTDGTGASALFYNPYGIALDSTAANIYVADTLNQIIRKIVVSGVTVTTIAGTANLSGSLNGVGAAARFNNPQGIAVDTSGNIYVADTVNQIIRSGGPATTPAITGQPANSTVTAPAAASFTVATTGNPTPTYQWQRNPGGTGSFANISALDANYTGSTAATLNIPVTSAAMTLDKFQVVVTNAQGTVTSNGLATLTVNQAPAITNTNTTPTFAINAAGSFTVTATGNPAPMFSVTSGTFPGFASLNTTTGAITGTPVSAGGPFTFVITATNSVSTATQSFTLTVQNGAVVTTAPVSQNIALGFPATFTVAASGTPSTFTYQWQRQAANTSGFINLAESTPYTGTTTASLAIGATTLAMNGDQFQVIVSNVIGSPATSVPVTLTVTQAPVFTSVASTTFAVSTLGVFNVTASGSPAPTFSVTGGAFPGWASLNTTTGAITGIPPDLTGSPFSFTLTATSTGSAPVTQAFTLTVSPTPLTPTFTTQPAATAVSIGQVATFTAAASGTPVPTYQWQRQANGTSGFVNLTAGTTYTGTTTGTLTINNATTGMSGDQFLVVATNTTGSTSSSAAVLTVNVGTVISTLAGQVATTGLVDGTGTAARFNNPQSIAVDALGNIYVADSSSQTIRKVTSAGVVTTLAGQPGVAGSADGTGSAARFNGPSGVAVDGNGNVYVADTFNHTIRVITPAGVVTTVAGLANVAGFADGAVATARFSYPFGVGVDNFGGIYVADTGNHTIRRFSINGFVTTMAGLAATQGSADGTGTVARFNSPRGLVVDAGGQVFVADVINHTIRKITQANVVTTVAGTAGLFGTADGTGSVARFNQPSGLTVDTVGNLYVTDTFNHTIRKITSAGVVTTLAGLAGTSGSADGLGSVARFNQPYGITVDAAGNLFIADTQNQTIRRSGLVTAPQITTQPVAKSAIAGSNVAFTVVATGAPTPSYQWQRQAAGTTGYVSIVNDTTYGGATTATLTVTGVTVAMSGDLFQCLVSNLVSPDATTTPVSLAIVVAPVFTSATSTTFLVGQSNSFTVVATSATAATYSATGLPSWATLDATSGVLSGTPPNTTGTPVTITLSASNGVPTTQTFTLTLVNPAVAPSITTQPASVATNRGGPATLTVAATGTGTLTYQWRLNGVSVTGATSSTLALLNVQPATAGNYTVVVTNDVGSATSTAATVALNSAPTITSQPRTQVVITGSTATFSVVATALPAPIYQWRQNGLNIVGGGGNGATLTITNAQASSAGNYDVVVTNTLGSVTSSLAQLTVSAAASAPVITSAPARRTAVIGTSTTFTAGASGAPAPTYQWLKNGVAISGATGASLTIGSVQAGDIGNYSVTVTNSAGSVTSAAGELRAIARSYAGIYFGSFGGTLGNFAIFIRPDNTGVFLGYLPGSTIAVRNLAFGVNDSGQFVFTQTATGAITASVGGQPVGAAPGDIVFNGAIASNGALSGTVDGVAGASLTATKSADAGSTQGFSGFYQAGAANSSSTALTILSAVGQSFVVTQTAATVDGGAGALSTSGVITVTTARQAIVGTVNTDTTAVVLTGTAGTTVTSYNGAGEAVIAAQRLANISTRARVGTGDAVSIAGFVISGTDSKPVLIRAVGPTLSGFGITTALTAPKLDLYRGSTVIATNTGWATAGNTAAITAASSQAGAFQLAATSADSVIFTTLAPGAYTAIVSSASGAAGVALVEVYDLSAPAAGQKLFNISTRASAGTGEATLTAGIVVSGSAPKRVLIRAVGPGLIQLGVTGVLAQPQLVLIKDTVTVAQNTGWGTSADASAIAVAATQVGAFPLVAGSGDSALLVSLAPGNYSAQVLGVGGTSGVAIVEVYELP